MNKCSVNYNEDGEPYHITLRYASNAEAKAQLDGSTAVVTSIEARQGECCVYGDDCVYVLEFLERLPFVQAATFGDLE